MAWKQKHAKFADSNSANHTRKVAKGGNGASAVLLFAKDRGKRTPLKNCSQGRKLTRKPDAGFGLAIGKRGMDWSNSMADSSTFTVSCGKPIEGQFPKVFSSTISVAFVGAVILSTYDWLQIRRTFTLQAPVRWQPNTPNARVVIDAVGNFLHDHLAEGFACFANANEQPNDISGEKPPKEI